MSPNIFASPQTPATPRRNVMTAPIKRPAINMCRVEMESRFGYHRVVYHCLPRAKKRS